ncbi:MAG: toll/interleukin-1 receptor domain-containing protein, partial [Clostridia bacterium]|nr:toll/interleukin-1 receptor domain-containing protein [Clostridia bacterium]
MDNGKIKFCTRCGEELHFDGREFRCEKCGMHWTEDAARLTYEAFKFTVRGAVAEALDEFHKRRCEEKVANLRQLLWQEIHTNEPYVDCEKVGDYAEEILKISPYETDAKFYALVAENKWRKANEFLKTVRVEKAVRYVEGFVDFLTKPWEEKYSAGISYLVEECFAETSEERIRCDEKISEAVRLKKDGTFNPRKERKVFVGYSSKDNRWVLELVQALEARGLECFVSFRNSLKGRNAHLTYEKDLRDAIDHCRVFVFVSSNASRSEDCYASEEMQYIRQKDIGRLSPKEQIQYEANYKKLDTECKKPRVEWLLEDYTGTDWYEDEWKKFFHNFSRYVELDAVVEAVARICRGEGCAPSIEEDKPSM